MATIPVAAFLLLAWRSFAVRAAVARLDRALPWALYLAVAVATALAAAGRPLRLAGWPATRRLAGPAGLAGSVVASCVPVFSAWHTGRWWAMIGGSLPWSDAQLYAGGAERLLFFGRLDEFNSRRPLNAMYLAVRLATTSLDLRLAVLVQAVLLGVACWLAARAVARDLGPLAGFALFAGIYAFARVYAPATMSEALGVTFGAVAFAVVWTAIRRRDRWLAVGGSFLLVVALDARTGAVLVALVVPIWLARHLARRPKGTGMVRAALDWPLLAVLAVVVAAATAMNVGLVAALGGDTANASGNGGFQLYGLARGLPSWDQRVPSWSQVYGDHPEIIAMGDAQRNRFVYRQARAEVVAHPVRFATTSLRSELNYLRMAKADALRLLPARSQRTALAVAGLAAAAVLAVRAARGDPGDRRRLVVDVALFAASVIALPVVVSKVPSSRPPPAAVGPGLAAAAFLAFLVAGSRRLPDDGYRSFALATAGAVAVSVPLLGVDTVRVFAATAPMLAVPLALAVAVLARPAPAPARAAGRAPMAVGGALLGAILAGTPVAMAAVPAPALSPRACPDGRPAEPLVGGVAVHLVTAPHRRRALDEIELAAIGPQLRPFTPVPANLLKEVTGPATLVGGLRADGADRLAVVDAHVAAPRSTPLYLCGAARHDPLTDGIFALFPQPLDLFRGEPAPSP